MALKKDRKKAPPIRNNSQDKRGTPKGIISKEVAPLIGENINNIKHKDMERNR